MSALPPNPAEHLQRTSPCPALCQKRDIVPLIEEARSAALRARFPSRFEIAAQDCMSRRCNLAVLKSEDKVERDRAAQGLTWRA